MKRAAAAFLVVLTLLSAGACAQNLLTGNSYAFQEVAPAGDHFWCVFPDVDSRWAVVLYVRHHAAHRWWQPASYTYVPLVSVTKRAGAPPARNYQMMLVPPHRGRDCLLVVYRNGIQQRYMGWTAFNPFGWHTFGIEPPVQAYIAEIPPGVPDIDILRYERMMIRTRWRFPLPLPRDTLHSTGQFHVTPGGA